MYACAHTHTHTTYWQRSHIVLWCWRYSTQLRCGRIMQQTVVFGKFDLFSLFLWKMCLWKFRFGFYKIVLLCTERLFLWENVWRMLPVISLGLFCDISSLLLISRRLVRFACLCLHLMCSVLLSLGYCLTGVVSKTINETLTKQHNNVQHVSKEQTTKQRKAQRMTNKKKERRK